MNTKRAAFIVEHDFIMATYMADKVIVFDGIPAKESYCTSPESLVTGMNRFLKLMDITFRRDPTNFRPRINKWESQKDQEQKASGNYFLMETLDSKKKKPEGEKEAEEDLEQKQVAASAPDSDEDKEEKKPAKKGKKKKKVESDDEEGWV